MSPELIPLIVNTLNILSSHNKDNTPPDLVTLISFMLFILPYTSLSHITSLSSVEGAKSHYIVKWTVPEELSVPESWIILEGVRVDGAVVKNIEGK